MDIHPLIVHFPIVCILLAAIFDTVAHLTRFGYFHKTGLVLLIGGALATIPSAFTGEWAAEWAQRIPDIEDTLHHHQDLSTIALWLSLALAASRIHLVARRRYEGRKKLIHMFAVTGCAGLILWSAYIGGTMVYDYGAGTAVSKVTNQK